MNQTILAGALSAVSLSLAAPAFAGPVLDKVKANDVVVCGVNTAAPGFSNADSKGNWTGLDVDYCRALAAAVLGDANKVKFVPLNSPQRFSALQAGEVDVLARNTTWNLTRDASLGAVFVGTNYYDGQGFLVPKKLNVKSAQRRHYLCPIRNQQRAQRRRLLQVSRHEVQSRSFRHHGSHSGRFPLRQMSGLHNRYE